jgi:hypothetical protein
MKRKQKNGLGWVGLGWVSDSSSLSLSLLFCVVCYNALVTVKEENPLQLFFYLSGE